MMLIMFAAILSEFVLIPSVFVEIACALVLILPILDEIASELLEMAFSFTAILPILLWLLSALIATLAIV